METFSALQAICAGNSPVTGEFPTQRPVTRSFDVFFDLRPNERLSKQSWGWWLETLSSSLWRHRNAKWIYIILLQRLMYKCSTFEYFSNTLDVSLLLATKYITKLRDMMDFAWIAFPPEWVYQKYSFVILYTAGHGRRVVYVLDHKLETFVRLIYHYVLFDISNGFGWLNGRIIFCWFRICKRHQAITWTNVD